MTSPNQLFDLVEERRSRLAELHQAESITLQTGGGGGTSEGMEERVAKLETHFGYVRKDLDEIKADQKTIITALSALPTKRDLTTNILVMVAIGLSVLAITVGGIVGGLAWLDRATDPRPAQAAVEPWQNDPIVRPPSK